MSDFGKGTCRLIGVLIGSLLFVGLTGGLDDPISPDYHTTTSETGE